MSDTTTEEISWFFAFYEQRAANAAAMHEHVFPAVQNIMRSSGTPDMHVLVAAGLDSLAKHWEATFSPKTTTASHRMGAFLARNADQRIFAKCSAPHLLLRAERAATGTRPVDQQRGQLVPLVKKFLGREGTPGAVRTWEHDPDMRDVLADRDVRALGINEGWLRKSQYGEALYEGYRSMWLHEFRLSPDWAEENSKDQDSEPRYQNLMKLERATPPHQWRRVQRPLFPRRFMLKTYTDAIASFRSECEQNQVCPRRKDG